MKNYMRSLTHIKAYNDNAKVIAVMDLMIPDNCLHFPQISFGANKCKQNRLFPQTNKKQ